MAEAEDAYHIKLEAHTMLADRAVERTEKSSNNSVPMAKQILVSRMIVLSITAYQKQIFFLFLIDPERFDKPTTAPTE
jgi:hypothetical protein